MQKELNILRKIRVIAANIVGALTNEELNRIPAGFNNNIIWNFGHLIAAQQGVCYLRAGLPTVTERSVFDKYKPDSKPETITDELEVKNLSELLFSTIDALEKHLAEKKFTNYPAWTTRYGVDITSIEDAVQFLLFHEGLHIGYMMALRRAVKA